MAVTSVNIKRTALRSGFFLFDSCIKVDNSDVSNWAVMFSAHPLASRKERLPYVKTHMSHFKEGESIRALRGLHSIMKKMPTNAIRLPKPDKYS